MKLLNQSNMEKIKKLLPHILFIVCICVFVFSVFLIGKKLYAYYYDDTQYQKIREQISADHSTDSFASAFTSTEPEESSPEAGASASTTLLPYIISIGNIEELDKNNILSAYSALKSQNADLAGWIQMPGFKKPIDYPVMHSEDNNFYLTHDFYRNESQAGSIFMDSRNNSREVDRHIILYGHAMKDMSMFGNLKEFPNKPSDYVKNTRIYLDLLYTRLEYEVFATYYNNEAYNYRQTSFSNDEEYLAFIDKLRLNSVYDYKIKLTAMDKILTLSTCNNNLGNNMRSITHARLIRQIVYDGKADGQLAVNSLQQASKEVISANVYLKQLSLEYGDAAKPEKALLYPAFASGLKEFAAQLPPEVETARLILERADPEAAIEVELNGLKAEINSLKLEHGDNIIKIKIVSRDKIFSRTITLTVNRAPAATPGVLTTVSPTITPTTSFTVLPAASPSPSTDTLPSTPPIVTPAP